MTPEHFLTDRVSPIVKPMAGHWAWLDILRSVSGTAKVQLDDVIRAMNQVSAPIETLIIPGSKEGPAPWE